MHQTSLSNGFKFTCTVDYFYFIHLINRCLTGSYDRTCKVWDIDNGAELLSLEGHKNVVYAVAFNNPIS